MTQALAPPRLGDYDHALAVHQQSVSFVRLLSCFHKGDWPARIDRYVAASFETSFPRDPHRELVTKAAVAPGTSSDAQWAGPLAQVQPLTNAFVEFAYGASILGKL